MTKMFEMPTIVNALKFILDCFEVKPLCRGGQIFLFLGYSMFSFCRNRGEYALSQCISKYKNISSWFRSHCTNPCWRSDTQIQCGWCKNTENRWFDHHGPWVWCCYFFIIACTILLPALLWEEQISFLYHDTNLNTSIAKSYIHEDQRYNFGHNWIYWMASNFFWTL